MNPGDLKQRLSFMLPTPGVDKDGFPIGGKSLYTNAWAKLKTLKGRTFYAAASTNMEHNREFTIRYQRKLEDGFRPNGLIVVWKNIEHEIVSIENDNGLNVSMTVVTRAVNS